MNAIVRFLMKLLLVTCGFLKPAQAQIAVALGLVGTPMSVLMNSQGQQVYSTHESDKALDTLLGKLAAGQQLPPADNTAISFTAQQQLLLPLTKGEHYLFFYCQLV